MSIQQGQTMLLNSTADPLPTAENDARFPLSSGMTKIVLRY